MRPTRRSMLAACAGALPALAAPPPVVTDGRNSLGLVIHSFTVRTARDKVRLDGDRFSDPARFLDHARALGARGIQVGLGVRDDADAGALRDRAAAASMYLEGI